MSRDPRKRAVRAVLQRHYPRLGLLNDNELVKDLVALIPVEIPLSNHGAHVFDGPSDVELDKLRELNKEKENGATEDE